MHDIRQIFFSTTRVRWRSALRAGTLIALMSVLLPLGQLNPAASAPAASAVSERPDAPVNTARPMPAPDRHRSAATAGKSCTAPDDHGNRTCVEPVKPSEISKSLQAADLEAEALVPPPEWCNQAQGVVLGTRNELCFLAPLSYTTVRDIEGVPTVTGEALLLTLNYSYTDTSTNVFAHQFHVTALDGWGAALSATLTAQATATGSCTMDSFTFPSHPVSPLGAWGDGEAYIASTATAAGAIGTCATSWTVTATNTGYPPAVQTYQFNEVRCDNATGGRLTPGCVVPWAPEALVYSSAVTPEIAAHVQQAQASGLPGGSETDPLTRTEDETIINTNRNLACGDAPSIEGLSCDEYPIASSYEGLSAGGARRTFSGCQIPNVGSGTGPTGVSVCMVTGTENSSQGGTNTQFFRAWRVLDGDPFFVLIS